jgi:hypothetical protein
VQARSVCVHTGFRNHRSPCECSISSSSNASCTSTFSQHKHAVACTTCIPYLATPKCRHYICSTQEPLLCSLCIVLPVRLPGDGAATAVLCDSCLMFFARFVMHSILIARTIASVCMLLLLACLLYTSATAKKNSCKNR